MLRRGEKGRYGSMDWTTESMDGIEPAPSSQDPMEGTSCSSRSATSARTRATSFGNPPCPVPLLLDALMAILRSVPVSHPLRPSFPKVCDQADKSLFASALAHSRSSHAASLAIPADSHYHVASAFSVWPRSSHQRHPEHQIYHHHHFRPSPAPQNSLVDALETPPLTHLLCIASLYSRTCDVFSRHRLCSFVSTHDHRHCQRPRLFPTRHNKF